MAELVATKSSEEMAHNLSTEQDDSEEFEIIQEEHEDLQHAAGTSENTPVRTTYIEKSVAPSECTDIGDIGDGLDCGKSVCSEGHSHTGRFLDSVYMSQLSQDNTQLEKAVESLKGECEQNREVLVSINNMVTELHKEKHDNAELRSQLEVQKAKAEEAQLTIEQLEKEIEKKINEKAKNEEEYERLLVKIDTLNFQNSERESKLSSALQQVASEKQSLFHSTSEMREHFENVKLRESEKDRKIAFLAEELERKCSDMEKVNMENFQLKKALEEVREEASSLKAELTDHKEIVRILQEENTDVQRATDTLRKEYREKLDSVEEQLLRYHQCGEVNFAEAGQ
jgi:chromosome segregation ATPase